MPPILALVPLLIPLALFAAFVAGLREPGRRPGTVLAACQTATLASLALAVLAGLAVAFFGPATSPLLGVGEIGLSLRLDALSAVMLALVTFVGVIVVRFSRNYLDGDDRQGAFMGGLCLTLAAVSLLILSGNLYVFVFAWIATSLALQRLLLFYGNRPNARVAGRKKFVVARLGDVLVIAAAVLLAQGFATTDIAAILEAARDAAATGEVPPGIGTATLLVALAALLKSAQFPTHGWLAEVMETPTPVSALLHAGIINAGGFLVVRFADVMLLSLSSLHVLAIVGGFTALFGSIVMLTQTSVKVALAYSTVAQMGFMLLQCGLGAFTAAVLHIVAHSLYKAHAFLSSGSIIDLARASWVPKAETRSRALILAASVAAALVIFVGTGAVVGFEIAQKPAIVALGAILVMGLTLLLAQALEGRPNGYVVGRSALTAAAVALVYFGLQSGAEFVLAGAVPLATLADPLTLVVMALVLVMFGALTALQILAPYKADAPRWRAAYVAIQNGFYANAWFNRLVGALRRPAAVRP
ncbi:MAG: proton-conducting transporter membrane subunit [Pseudomonadota bacterium]